MAATNDSGFTSFEDARQALIFRYYHPQADFQTHITQPRDNSEFGQNVSAVDRAPCPCPTGDVYTSTLARKAATFPVMETMLDFAREYILLLAQWNQKDDFQEDKIREFVYYVEARKGSFSVPVTSAQIYDANATYLTQNVTSTTQPWSRGNDRFVRELANIVFNPLKNRT